MVMRFEEIKNFGINFTDNPDLKQLGASDAADKKFLVFVEFKKYLEKQGINLTDKEIMEMLNSNGGIEALPADNLSEVFNNILNLGNTVENDAAATAELNVEPSEPNVQVPESGESDYCETVDLRNPTPVIPQGASMLKKNVAKVINPDEGEIEIEESPCYDNVFEFSPEQMNEMSLEVQMTYVAEHSAKNAYIFELGDRTRGEEDWEKYKASKPEDYRNLVNKHKEYLKNYTSGSIQDYILDIDAATGQGMTLATFNKEFNNEEKEALKYAVLEDIVSKNLGDYIKDKPQLELDDIRKELISNPKSEYWQHAGITEKQKSFMLKHNLKTSIKTVAEKCNMDYDVVLRSYYNPKLKASDPMYAELKNAIPGFESRTESKLWEKQSQYVQQAPIGLKFGTHTGEKSLAEKMHISSLSVEDKEKYDNAPRAEQLTMLRDWIVKNVKTPEEYKALINSTWETLDFEVQDMIYREIISKNPKLRSAISQQTDLPTVTSNTIHIGTLDATKITESVIKHAGQDDKGTLLTNIHNNGTDEQTVLIYRTEVEQQTNLTPEQLAKATKNAQEKACNKDQAEEIAKLTQLTSQSNINESMDNAIGTKYEGTFVGKALEGNPDSAIYFTQKKLGRQLSSENQVPCMKEADKSLDGLPKSKAIEYKKELSDQVGDLATENQLNAHEIFAKSKYSEVAEYAAQNIYTYDKSVQADAYKTSYEYAQESGNSRIIDNLNSNYSRMAPEAQEQIASNPHYAQALSNYTANAIAQDKVLPQLINNESSAGIPKTEKEIFREQWQAMTPTEKYNFICNISLKNFSKLSPAMRKRVLEHAKNDPVFMKNLVKKYGLDLLKNQLFPDALGAIVRELLNDPSEKIKTAREVCQNPSRYPAAIVELCQQLVAEHNDIKEEDFNHLSATDKRAVTNDPTLYEQNFASVGAQSGSNKSNLIGKDDYFKKRANLSFLT